MKPKRGQSEDVDFSKWPSIFVARRESNQSMSVVLQWADYMYDASVRNGTLDKLRNEVAEAIAIDWSDVVAEDDRESYSSGSERSSSPSPAKTTENILDNWDTLSASLSERWDELIEEWPEEIRRAVPVATMPKFLFKAHCVFDLLLMQTERHARLEMEFYHAPWYNQVTAELDMIEGTIVTLLNGENVDWPWDEERTTVLEFCTLLLARGDTFDGKPASTKVQKINASLICAFCKSPHPNLQECGGCNQVQYCDTSCQRADWHNHGLNCNWKKK